MRLIFRLHFMQSAEGKENNMRTKEELNALKEEVETLNKKLHELTDEELAQVSGGDYVCSDDSGHDPNERRFHS